MVSIVRLVLLVILVGIHCESSSGEKLDRLENLIANLSNKFGDFVAAVDKITHILTRMEEQATLNDLIKKCSEYIGTRNEVGVNKIWNQIIKSHSKAVVILNQIVVEAYAGKRENILPLIRFIHKTNKCSGYETLFKEMKDYGHFYGGGEIFSLAHTILNKCSPNMFEKLPQAVQLILTRNVSLQNTFNKGYLYRKMNARDNGLENHIATTKSANMTDFWTFKPTSDYADTFIMKNRNMNLVASPSRRFYFSSQASSKFYLEMNSDGEVGIGTELDTQGGKRFYRLYAQKNKIRSGDSFDVNLWTINPEDEYFKYIYWIVAEKD